MTLKNINNINCINPNKKQINDNNIKFYFLFHKKIFNRKKRIRFCFKTKRTRGFYSFFNLSRQTIKEFAKNEQLPGILKSSW